MNYFNKYPKETIQAIKESKTLSDVFKCLNISDNGGNRRSLKRFISINNIDISHFKRKLTKEDYEKIAIETKKEILQLEYRRNAAVNDYIDSNIKDDEIEKYYKNEIFGEVKASHILIMPSVSENATSDETETAESR